MGLIALFRTPEYRNLPTWMKLMRQTEFAKHGSGAPYVDQVAHVTALAVAALAVTGLS